MNNPAKRKLNVKLLRKIQKHILEEPRRFFMAGLVATGTPGATFENSNWYEDLPSIVPRCGTSACIAGWTALLSGKSTKQAGILSLNWSARRLGLSPRVFGSSVDGRLVSPLFYSANWPDPFRARYAKAKTPKTRAKIAVARIDHLIKEGK